MKGARQPLQPRKQSDKHSEIAFGRSEVVVVVPRSRVQAWIVVEHSVWCEAWGLHGAGTPSSSTHTSSGSTGAQGDAIGHWLDY